MDLVCLETVTIPAHGTHLFPLGFSMVLPPNVEAQIRSRSGNSLRGLVVANSPGTVDPGYRGEVGVIMQNTTNKPMVVGANSKIAQMVLAPFITMSEAVVKEGEAPMNTARGGSGFGSTGGADGVLQVE
jgi:dUTP pyrophosphatase